MDIIETETHLINAYEFNNRKHSEEQISRIASSIREFGFNQPIVIDENNIVLVGHGRLYAAKSLNLDKVPSYKITGLTEVQKKAYRILDNKLQNDSTWQFDNLDLELGFLEDNGFELEPWGLDQLIVQPTILDDVDIGGENRESDYTRRFCLTKEQAEEVDRAILSASKIADTEGNKNAAALAAICSTWITQNG